MLDPDFNEKCFNDIANRNIEREGIENLLWFLKTSDFFTAPCSTKYHLSVPGGLCEHSLNVYHALNSIIRNYEFENKNRESIAIVSLFHDICKVNTYKEYLANRKNADGEWEQYTAYRFDEDYAFGHAEKSVYLISQFIHLTPVEAQAINAHMGFSDVRGANLIGNIFKQNRLALLLHFADMTATYCMEDEK